MSTSWVRGGVLRLVRALAAYIRWSASWSTAVVVDASSGTVARPWAALTLNMVPRSVSAAVAAPMSASPVAKRPLSSRQNSSPPSR